MLAGLEGSWKPASLTVGAGRRHSWQWSVHAQAASTARTLASADRFTYCRAVSQLGLVVAMVVVVAVGCSQSESPSDRSTTTATAPSPGQTTTAERTPSVPPGKGPTVRASLKGWVAHPRGKGSVTFQSAGANLLRIDLDVDLPLDYYPVEVSIYGWGPNDPAVFDCDEVYNQSLADGRNEIYALVLAEAGGFTARTPARAVNGSFAKIAAAADSVAVWWRGDMLACGEVPPATNETIG